MSGIGPELPPHLLAKRKRREAEAEEDGPTTASGAKRPTSPDAGEKRRKVIGPAMPPAPLEERPTKPLNPTGRAGDEDDSDEDDEDDFGPALPTNKAQEQGTAGDGNSKALLGATQTSPDSAPKRLRRDDWMMMPPKQDDLAARLDPSKQRARGFNTGKGAKGPSALGEDNSIWNETPEQKQKRLQDEMMGIVNNPLPGSLPGPQNAGRGSRDTKTDSAAAARTRERIESARGPSLMDQHKGSKDTEPEDDPSQRAFDREKDMGSGQRIGHTKRKEMLNKAAGFSSRFAGGSYL